MKILQFLEFFLTNLMKNKDPKQPTPAFDNVQVTSGALFLEEVPSPKRATRKRCRSYYDILSKNEGAKKARDLARKVNTYCGACEGKPFLCISCFSVKHDSLV